MKILFINPDFVGRTQREAGEAIKLASARRTAAFLSDWSPHSCARYHLLW